METFAHDGRFERLIDAGMMGRWLVNTNKCDIRDLIDARPGQIVRVTSNDAIRFIPVETSNLEGCIAGWISEDE